MIELASVTDCTGCKACGDACPVNAVKFQTDAKGFWHPVIDHSACIKCGRCRKTCVVLKDSQSDIQKTTPVVYSAYSKEFAVREKSTSGGMFYELSAHVISHGGVVCGCRFSDDYRAAYHTFAENMDELEPLLSSKYFQSDTGGVYRRVRGFLQDGRKVLFCGAPCQSAALQRYLPANLLENLITVDFICLGINSPKGYLKFVDELEDRYGAKARKVRFKDKSRGWQNLGTKVWFENGKEYYGNRYTDAWVNSYVVGKFMIRRSCAVCRFKGLPRVSDITIGDFWGGDYTCDERKNGVSLVLLNSPKGEELFRAVQPKLVINKTTLETIGAGNPMMESSVKLNGELQDAFFKRLENEKFSEVAWSLLHRPVWKRYARWYADLLKDMVRRAVRGK
ncbi:Coenzyme F420 hydrogenase/dehydrogenase, beta subunit C-terminal domain [Cloacibacillus sp. An23]|uniref:Coenzyme F420 hydrogenase/dehydrogenase, beta subunit C-terminal domain n=1 Tax=Cloacibacillus sp. An23 TaxID=1965591 RepID=UPI002101B16A|nr:Coenzyme F420 hydrogenase/dehydrogenase, beta subunit C-terminal domain [Cloacibacillus sp. An23]